MESRFLSLYSPATVENLIHVFKGTSIGCLLRSQLLTTEDQRMAAECLVALGASEKLEHAEFLEPEHIISYAAVP